MDKLTPISVCVVTASRSEFGLLRWVIHDLQDDPRFALKLVVTGTHTSSKHGSTSNEIVAAGLPIDLAIPVDLDEGSGHQLTTALSKIVSNLGEFLTSTKPDFVVVLGDRWELLGVASACTLTGTPLVHFSGGEVTEGALDDSCRHAVTKLSHLHFVANEIYASRIRQLGEEDWRICVSGGPGLDNFTRLRLLERDALSADIGLDLAKPTAVVTYHPETLSAAALERDLAEFVAALRDARDRLGLQMVITGPCADPGADRILQELEAFVAEDPGKSRFFMSLGQIRYISLLKCVSVMLGNSSSAFHEAPLAKLMAVNVGDRQCGRISGSNVIHAKPSREAILEALQRALQADRSQEFYSPYGYGSASRIALNFIAEKWAAYGKSGLLRKRFIDHENRA